MRDHWAISADYMRDAAHRKGLPYINREQAAAMRNALADVFSMSDEAFSIRIADSQSAGAKGDGR